MKKILLTFIMMSIISGRGISDKPIQTSAIHGNESDIVYGNTVSNAANYSFATEDNDWIYFVDTNGVDKGGEIMRMSKTTDAIESLSDCRANDVAIVNGTVYFTDIQSGYEYSRLSTTDGVHKSLGIGIADFEHIVGDWIYYSNGDDSYSIYKSKLDGSDTTKLNDSESLCLSVSGNNIVYINVDDNFWLHLLDIESGTSRRILDMQEHPYADPTILDDWVYYIGEGKLSKCNIETKEIVDLIDADIGGYNISDGKIIFADVERNSMRLYDMDNSTIRDLFPIAQDSYYWHINVVNNWVFYKKDSIEFGELHMERFD